MIIETWKRDDESRKVTYGKDFFNTVFKMNENECLEGDKLKHTVPNPKNGAASVVATVEMIAQLE